MEIVNHYVNAAKDSYLKLIDMVEAHPHYFFWGSLAALFLALWF